MLRDIVARTHADVAERQSCTPVAELFEGLAPSDRSFMRAVRGDRQAFILEVKPASPSRGHLRAVESLDPVIAAYSRYADAISVLTNAPFFGGSFELLRRVRRATKQPILCKDFIVSPYQVVEARYHGADAVLLMLSVLDDETYHRCAQLAQRLGMGVLTEVHTADEMRRAALHGAACIGINNRDLSTLRVNLARTAALAPLAPREAVVIAESGFSTRDSIERLGGVADGFLIGSAIMGSAEPSATVRELVLGRTKVCGLTRPQDAQAAAESGVTHGGLVFTTESRRYVSEERAVDIVSSAPLEWVGVFVNETPVRVATTAAALQLAAVQLHGDETREVVEATRALLPVGCELWKGVRVRGRIPTIEETGASRVLLDGYTAGLRGGSGQRFDWSLLDEVHDRSRYLVAGGLAAANARSAASLGAHLIDVSSGVEEAPGAKNAAKIVAFMEERRRSVRRRGDDGRLARTGPPTIGRAATDGVAPQEVHVA